MNWFSPADSLWLFSITCIVIGIGLLALSYAVYYQHTRLFRSENNQNQILIHMKSRKSYVMTCKQNFSSFQESLPEDLADRDHDWIQVDLDSGRKVLIQINEISSVEFIPANENLNE